MLIKDSVTNHDIGTVLIRDGSHDNSSMYNSGWLGTSNIIDYSSSATGIHKQLFNNTYLHANNSSTGHLDGDSQRIHRFNYKGVQVMRNGDVSPQYSGDLLKNKPPS